MLRMRNRAQGWTKWAFAVTAAQRWPASRWDQVYLELPAFSACARIMDAVKYPYSKAMLNEIVTRLFRKRRTPYRSRTFRCSTVSDFLSELYSPENEIQYGLYLRSSKPDSSKIEVSTLTFFRAIVYQRTRERLRQLFDRRNLRKQEGGKQWLVTS